MSAPATGASFPPDGAACHPGPARVTGERNLVRDAVKDASPGRSGFASPPHVGEIVGAPVQP